MHPRDFGSDNIFCTYALPPDHVSWVKFCISSTPRVSAVNRMATRTFREKKKTKTLSFDYCLTSILRLTDTWEVLYQWQIPQKGNVDALHDSKLQNCSLARVRWLCHAFRQRGQERFLVTNRRNVWMHNEKVIPLFCFSLICFLQVKQTCIYSEWVHISFLIITGVKLPRLSKSRTLL